jgi:hypothetical protein
MKKPFLGRSIYSLGISIIGLLFTFLSSATFAAPAQIIIIRHAEKPATGSDLSPQGYQRANDLPPVFLAAFGGAPLGPPVAVYAMAPKPPDGTMRPIETVTPLVKVLQETNPSLPFITTFEKKKSAELAQDIMSNPLYDGKRVVICWEHHAIPDVAMALGGPSNVIPDKWHGSVFDAAWVLNYNADGSFASFQATVLDVLPGDAANDQLPPSDPPEDE